MTVQVRTKDTNKVITTKTTNNWAEMFVQVIDVFRREYTNATIEVYYGKANGTPNSTYSTYH